MTINDAVGRAALLVDAASAPSRVRARLVGTGVLDNRVGNNGAVPAGMDTLVLISAPGVGIEAIRAQLGVTGKIVLVLPEERAPSNVLASLAEAQIIDRGVGNNGGMHIGLDSLALVPVSGVTIQTVMTKLAEARALAGLAD